MIEAVAKALRDDVKRRGLRWAGDDDYAVTNTEALELFEELLACEKNGFKKVVSRTVKRERVS
jgi:hypothetical protein